MRIFTLQSKKHLAVWSLILGLVLVFISQFFGSAGNCIDYPCSLDYGWPLVFNHVDNEVGIPSIAKPGHELDGSTLTYINVKPAAIPTWSTDTYYFGPLVLDCLLWISLAFVLLIVIKRVVPKEHSEKSIIYLSCGYVGMVLFIYLLSFVPTNQFGLALIRILLSILIIFLASLIVSISIIRSKAPRNYRLISSLIFGGSGAVIISFFAYALITGDVSVILFVAICYLTFIFITPITLCYFKKDVIPVPLPPLK